MQSSCKKSRLTAISSTLYKAPDFKEVRVQKNGSDNAKNTFKLKFSDKTTFLEFLEDSTQVLCLARTAKYVFKEDGSLVQDLSEVRDGELVYVSDVSQFISPDKVNKCLKRKLLLEALKEEVEKMRHLNSLYQLQGSLLGCYSSPSPGGTVGLLHMEPSQTTPTFMSHDQSCDQLLTHSFHYNNVQHEPSPGHVTKPLVSHDAHQKSHQNAEDRFHSKLPFWMKEVGGGDTEICKESTTCESRVLTGPQYAWAYHRRHLVLVHHPRLALVVDSSKVIVGSQVCVSVYSEMDERQHWTHHSDGSISPSSDTSLVLSVAGIGYPSAPVVEKARVCLLRRGRQLGAGQKWLPVAMENTEGVWLQAFAGEEWENYVTFSQWSDLCTHGALGSGPQMQFGFELETKDPLHPEPVELCVSCGTVLKRQCPTLLLKEMEQERHFVCSFWSSNTAKKGHWRDLLKGKSLHLARKVDLSKWEISHALNTLQHKLTEWKMCASSLSIRNDIDGMGEVSRLNVIVNWNGSVDHGHNVSVSSWNGLLTCGCLIFQMPTPTAVYTEDGTLIQDLGLLKLKGSTPPEVWLLSEGTFIDPASLKSNSGSKIKIQECKPLPTQGQAFGTLTARPMKTSSAILTSRAPQTRSPSGQVRQRTGGSVLALLVCLCGRPARESVLVRGRSLEELLDKSTYQLQLNFPARSAFTENGKKVTSVDFLKLSQRQLLYISQGHTFFTDQDVLSNIAIKSKWYKKHKLYK